MNPGYPPLHEAVGPVLLHNMTDFTRVKCIKALVSLKADPNAKYKVG